MAALFFPRKIKPPASNMNHYVLDPAAVAGKPEVLKYAELRLALEVPLQSESHYAPQVPQQPQHGASSHRPLLL
jgi:hypothetical protein